MIHKKRHAFQKKMCQKIISFGKFPETSKFELVVAEPIRGDFLIGKLDPQTLPSQGLTD